MSEQTEIVQDELSYEEAFARLEVVIAGLESGDLSLEESLARYEEGVELATLCERLLESTELRVRQWQPGDSLVELDDWEDP